MISTQITRRLQEAAESFYAMSLVKRSVAGWKGGVSERQARRRIFEESTSERSKRDGFIAWQKFVRTCREEKRLKLKSNLEIILAKEARQRGDLLSRAFEALDRHALRGALHRQATRQLNRTRARMLMHKALFAWKLVQKDIARQLLAAAHQRTFDAKQALSILQQQLDEVLQENEKNKQRLERAIEDRDAMDVQLKQANDRERDLLAAARRMEKEAALERARLSSDLALARRQILEAQHQMQAHTEEGGEKNDTRCGASSPVVCRMESRVLDAVRAVMGSDVQLNLDLKY